MNEQTGSTVESSVEIMEDQRHRVQRGIQYILDTYGQEGLDRIDLDAVRVNDVHLCPLAQASGQSYWRAIEYTDMEKTFGVPAARGFESLRNESNLTLDLAWREALSALRTTESA